MPLVQARHCRGASTELPRNSLLRGEFNLTQYKVTQGTESNILTISKRILMKLQDEGGHENYTQHYEFNFTYGEREQQVTFLPWRQEYWIS